MFTIRGGIKYSPGRVYSVLPRRQLSLKPDFSKFKLIPQPPGHIVGDVNDAYIPPDSSFYHGSYHWAYERLASVAMVPLGLSPFIFGNDYPMVDYSFSTLLLYHVHSGFQSCIIDYIPKRVYGIWHKMAMGLLTLGSSVGLYGIYLLETADNGLFGLVAKIFGA